MLLKNIDKLVTDALAIEAQEAKEAGALGFMARALTQATLPHKNVPGNEFTRQNGAFTLTILAPSYIGLPYGSYPRLLLSWITTEAVRTKDRELILGNTLSVFMTELGIMKKTGGRWGSITRLKQQMQRLFASSITCTYDDGETWALESIKPISKAQIWWDPKNPSQAALWESKVILGQEFFDEITTYPVPIDLRALKTLRKSPLALDIYTWLTYRMSYLKRTTEIPWKALQLQFGAGYSLDDQGTRSFKKAFLRSLRKVLVVYPKAKTADGKRGLVLKPSPPHIPHHPKTVAR